jgi:hypothetical protein
MDDLMRGHAMCIEKVRNAYKVVVRESFWKIPLERPNHRWGIVIK